MKNIIVLAAAAFLFLIGCANYMDNDSQLVLPNVKELPILIYPKEAQQNNLTGNSVVEIFISKTGTVMEARVINSSGYAVLDNAAKDYCEKIIFNPALAGGNPINSRSVFKVKFDLSNQDAFEKSYVAHIKKLYHEIEGASEQERHDIQRNIFSRHKEFYGNLQDSENCNAIILRVISSEIGDQWKVYMKYCPLTFLVYHDFVQRFPDFANITDAKEELRTNVLQNLTNISQLPASKFDTPIERENFIQLIKSFVQKYYPEISIRIENEIVINS